MVATRTVNLGRNRSLERGVTQALQDRKIYQTILDNGITVIAVENPAADIISARIFVRAGSRWDPPGQSGIANLMSAVLTKGTTQFSSLDIANQVESVGASLGADAAADYFLLSLKTVSADFANILALAAKLLQSPTFPEEEVKLEQRLVLQAIRSQQEQPFTVAFDQLRQSIYQDHAYALSGLGTEETVSRLNRTALQIYHQTYFRPDNIVISLAGRIAPETAISLVEKAFGDWRATPEPLPAVILPSITPQPAQHITCQETQQSILMLGYLAPPVQRWTADSHDLTTDYAVLKLLSTYLGNGLSSRLFVELREKRGLAYEVSAFYPTRLDYSHFVAYMGTAPENTAIALDGLQTEVERLCAAPLPDEELIAAKNKLLGQYALGKQTNSQIAQVLGWYETLGLTVDFDLQFQQDVAAVTPELAQQTACKYFSKPYQSIVGPQAAVDLLAVPAVL